MKKEILHLMNELGIARKKNKKVYWVTYVVAIYITLGLLFLFQGIAKDKIPFILLWIMAIFYVFLFHYKFYNLFSKKHKIKWKR